jgi:putative ABC transport system permease protein
MLIPPAVRPAARLAARGRGLVGYLSAAAAARRPTVDLVTAGALTAAATAAVFASCFTGTLAAARVTQSWQNVGADLRISSTAESGGALSESALAKVAAAPGIAAHAEATVLAAQQLMVPEGGVAVTVYIVDPAQYRGLVRGTPLDTPALESELDALAASHGAPGTVPALASPDLLGLVQGLPAGSEPTLMLSENTLDLTTLGSAGAFPPATGTTAYLVVPAAGLRQAMPAFQAATTVAWYTYKPGVSAAPAAAAQVPAAAVAERTATIGGYGSDLLSALSAWISRSAAVLDVLLAAACVLLAAAATAKARAASSAFLLTMGTRRRSAAAVSVIETVPMLVAVGAAAVAAGYGAAEALLPALAAIGGVPEPASATLPGGAVLAAAAVPLLGVLVTTAGAGFGREAQLSFQRTGG